MIASYGGRAEPGRVSGLALLQEEMSERTGLHVAQAFYNKRLLREAPDKALEKQLDRLRREAPERLTVLPTFLVPGKTWTAFQEQIRSGWSGLGQLRILAPVLERRESREALAKCLPGALSLEPEKNYLFVGHGTGEETDLLYLEMERLLQAQGFSGIRFALLHGKQGIREVTVGHPWEAGAEVRVVPFLVSAGKHIMRDLEGDCPQTAAQILQAAGYLPQVSTCGLMECHKLRTMLTDLILEKIEKAGT